MRIAATLAILLLAAAPSRASEPPVIPPDANFVVFRDRAEPRVWAATLSVDGKKIASLGQKTFTAIHLRPGNHGFDLDWPMLSGQNTPSGTVKIAEGQVIYLEVTGVSRVSGYRNGYIYMQIASKLEPRDETAISTITACCKFKPPSP